MTQENSSPSISINGRERLSVEEVLYLTGLPDGLANQLNDEEMFHLVRTEYDDWPQELKDKMEPYLDLEQDQDD